jgi:hypothetical protein
VHSLQGDRKAGRLLVAHIVSRNAVHPPGIGDHIFGKATGRGGHHPVAGLDALHVAADRFDFAGTLQTEPRADAADGTVLMAQGDQQIGAVEARGADPDQHLVRLRHRLWQVADIDGFFTQYGGLHDRSSGRTSIEACGIVETKPVSTGLIAHGPRTIRPRAIRP